MERFIVCLLLRCREMAGRRIKKYIVGGKFHGIFSNVQMFVVSNAIDTKYFSAARDTEFK